MQEHSSDQLFDMILDVVPVLFSRGDVIICFDLLRLFVLFQTCTRVTSTWANL